MTTTGLNLYNTMTREIAPFNPLVPGKASIYLCGATVQGEPHIGHIRSGVNFDILRRWLIHQGFDVTFIRNITDIDDKILHKAVHEQLPWWALAMKYEAAFTWAYNRLNLLPPTYEPRATGHIMAMIELMQILIDNGTAYAPGNGDVYLNVRSLNSYLTLSNQKLDDLLPSDETEASFKKDPRDFALWKAAKLGDPSWPTPWGPGRPGWHLECSAMAQVYLGAEFDIHGGGIDLIFPHHENEIAQSESAGWGFAKLWMHNAWVTTSGEKMSKSLGNSLLVSEIVKRVRGIELRWYLGGAHYRSMVEFSFEALEETGVNFRRIEGFLFRTEEIIGEMPGLEISDAFTSAMNDDLAVPTALAGISELVREGNTAITANDLESLRTISGKVRGALSILGCDPFDPAFALDRQSSHSAMDGLVNLALAQREAARVRRDFTAADAIRDQILELGILVEDTPAGPRWTLAR